MTRAENAVEKGLELLEPTTLAEAVASLADDGGQPVAGGIAAALLLKQGLPGVERLVSLRRIATLAVLDLDGRDLRIGAMVPLWDVAASALVRAHAPGLADAVRCVGNVRIRSIATLGGNLCHADPHCDPPAALLALDARVVLQGAGGRRELPIADFFTGYYETALRPGELLVEVRVPVAAPGTTAVYCRYTTTSVEDWPCVAVCVVARVEAGVFHGLRIGLAGAAARPLLVAGVDAKVPAAAIDETATLAADQADPIADLRGSEWYKREMVRVHARRALRSLLEKETT
jgi:carbon-monoxide dehydrogenase medium subunit